MTIRTMLSIGVLLVGITILTRMAIGEDATVVAPNHYRVEFENDAVRIIRITYGPGEASALHEHADGVVINLTAGNIQFTLPDGTTPATDPAVAGAAFWSAGAEHAARNLGNQPFEAVLVELKR